MIFSTRWLDGKDYIFERNKKWEKHANSDVVFNKLTTQLKIRAVKDSIQMNELFGIVDDINGVDRLITIANKLIDNNYGKVKYLQDDIERKSFQYLTGDIYNTINSNRSDLKLIEILSPYVTQKWTPLCLFLEDGDFIAFGINHPPRDCTPDPAWSRALIKDFSDENDSVILALHGQTDWWKGISNTGFGYMQEESEQLSKELERSIDIHVYLHDDSNYIAKAIKMKNSKLSDIWSFITSNKNG